MLEKRRPAQLREMAGIAWTMKAMTNWRPTFGDPATKSDDEVVRHLRFWLNRARQLTDENEPVAAAQARRQADEYREVAEERELDISDLS
ncbi:hypothetical protein ACWIGI_41395 [Nocardia sp. NPDC055321]